jgi:hypothetical protein
MSLWEQGSKGLRRCRQHLYVKTCGEERSRSVESSLLGGRKVSAKGDTEATICEHVSKKLSKECRRQQCV